MPLKHIQLVLPDAAAQLHQVTVVMLEGVALVIENALICSSRSSFFYFFYCVHQSYVRTLNVNSIVCTVCFVEYVFSFYICRNIARVVEGIDRLLFYYKKKIGKSFTLLFFPSTWSFYAKHLAFER